MSPRGDGLDPTSRKERPEKPSLLAARLQPKLTPPLPVPQTHIGPPLAKHIPVHKHQKDILASLSPPLLSKTSTNQFFSLKMSLFLLPFVFWIHFRRLGSEVRRGRMTGLEKGDGRPFFQHSLHAFAGVYNFCGHPLSGRPLGLL